jgi:cytochrome c biogenesis protein CcmG, thiol:disulfide interchange protein DsbE
MCDETKPGDLREPMNTISDNVTGPEPKKAGRFISFVAVVFFLALLVYALWPELAISRNAPTSWVPGAPAPGFTVPVYGGGELSLAGLRGSVVIVNFWASWCGPCRLEAPTLQQVWQDYQGKGVRFIGVDIQDTPEAARAFTDEFHLTYPNGPDADNSIARAYRITGVPETFLIDKDGRLARQFIGPIDQATVEGMLDQLVR